MTLAEALVIFEHLTGQKFYGSVEFKFEAGRILHARKIEILKGADQGAEQPPLHVAEKNNFKR